MIGFGELRKKSVEWQMEISAVEKIYARDWLLYGFFQDETLRAHLSLRGASALASAYFDTYPRVDDIDFARDTSLDDAALQDAIAQVARDAARASGLHFRVHSFRSSESRFEFTGPLGRRSAAQPLLIARFVTAAPHADIAERALVHPFRDACSVHVRALALEELAAQHIALYAQKPRARDVYDLWFMLTRGADLLDAARTRARTHAFAAEKRIALRSELDAAHAPFVARAWDNALKKIPAHPAFAQAQNEIKARLAVFLTEEPPFKEKNSLR